MHLWIRWKVSYHKYIKSLVTKNQVCTTRPEAAIVDDTLKLLPFNGTLQFRVINDCP